jgi:hypothetical protein
VLFRSAAMVIPPPEEGIELPAQQTLPAADVDDPPEADADAVSTDEADESAAESEEPSPRIVQVEKSWIETWAVGGRHPVVEAGPPRSDRRGCDEMGGPDKEGRDGERRCKRECNREERGKRSDESEPREPLLDGDCREEKRDASRDRRERRRDREGDEQWPEVRMILKSYNALIEFYENQGREEDMEQALKERIDICAKLAELRMLAEFDGPGAAMQEYYRYMDRPDRALELDIHNMERDIDRMEQEKAEAEAEMARLSSRCDILEGKIDELRERYERRVDELSGLQEEVGAREADDGASEHKQGVDEDEAAGAKDGAAPTKGHQMKKAAVTALRSMSFRLLTVFLL